LLFFRRNSWTLSELSCRLNLLLFRSLRIQTPSLTERYTANISVNLVDRRERACETARRGRTDSLDVPVEQLHAERLRPEEEEERPESVPRAP
jgi:hypothetical protein